MLTDATDSHYNWVKSRIETINPNRGVGGMLNAQDWPNKQLKHDTFYLLILGDVPVGKQGWSPSTPILLHQCQWVWYNLGTDLKQGVRMANRADRYRTMQTMKQELMNGLFPAYTEKLNWALVPTGNPPPNDNLWQGTSKTPQEFITWTPAEFHEKWDKESGMGYGAAAVRIQDMTDTITS